MVMHRHALQNNKLSWKAKGLLAHMLSMPDDWTFYREELVKHSTDGIDAVRSGMQELEKHGYLKRERYQTANGQFDWQTTVYETPEQNKKPLAEKPPVEKPLVENPPVDNPTVENPRLLSTDELSNDELSTDTPNIDVIPYVEIVNYLNAVAGKQYRHTTKKTRRLIKARYNENFRFQDFKNVIDKKAAEWKHGTMEKYLRPETLFGTKFEGYLNQETGTQNTMPGMSFDPAKDRF